MKNLFIIITLLLFSNILISQVPKQIQNLGAKGTNIEVRDQLSVDSALKLPKDTTKLLIKDTGALAYKNGQIFVWKQVNGNLNWYRTSKVSWCTLEGVDNLGLLDASTQLQLMINNGCKVIYIPSGIYLLKNTIQLKDSITILGDGKSTVIKLTQNKAGFRCGSINGQWVTFRDFSIQGSYTPDSILQEGIRIDTCRGVYMNNLLFSKTSSYAVHFYKDKVSTEANTILGCYFDSCNHAAVFADFAEFNRLIGNTVAYCDTGFKINSGNVTVDNNHITKGSVGIYLSGHSAVPVGDFNDGHTEMTGNIIAHNFFAGLYCDGVTNGQQIGYNIIRNNVGYDVYAQNSDNLWFDNCDLGTDSLVFVNCTNTNLYNNKIWNATTGRPGPPDQFLKWRVVGQAPTVFSPGYVANGISLYDIINNKRFDITHTNNVIDFTTTSPGRIRLNDSVIVGTNLFGSESSAGVLKLYSTTNVTKGMIYLGDSSVYDPVNKRIGINTIAPSYPLHLYRTTGTNAIQMTDNGPTSLSFIRMTNDVGNVAQLFFGGSGSSPFVPNSGFEIDGQTYLGIVSENGQISFGKSTTLNGSNEHGRFFNTGQFVLNTTTNNGHILQVNGAVSIKKDSMSIITSMGSNYLVTTDTTSGLLNRISASNLSSFVKLPHTIFIPTTGGTVNLINNTYNIINPAGTLVSVTINLPSSPANNDRVEIKYTQSVTTVTYSNGTVVDGITGPVAGQLVVLVYDSGTSSWY